MIGIILCGGASTRMGSDKGLLVEKNKTWTELAAQKLATPYLPIVISVNKINFLMIHLFLEKNNLLLTTTHWLQKVHCLAC